MIYDNYALRITYHVLRVTRYVTASVESMLSLLQIVETDGVCLTVAQFFVYTTTPPRGNIDKTPDNEGETRKLRQQLVQHQIRYCETW